METLDSRLSLLLIKAGKLLIQLAMDANLRNDLSKVYAQIDKDMPYLLKCVNPRQMTALFAAAITDATGQKATSDQIDVVVSLYNPIAATLRNFRP